MTSEDRNTRIKRDRIAGMSVTAIAKRYGISKARVYQICTSSNPYRPRPAAKTDRNAKVVADRRAGMSATNVAAKHGISIPRVYQILDKAKRKFTPPPVAECQVDQDQWNVFRGHAMREVIEEKRVPACTGAMVRAFRELRDTGAIHLTEYNPPRRMAQYAEPVRAIARVKATTETAP